MSLVWFGRVNYSIIALDSEPLLVKPGSLLSKMFCSLNNQYGEINIIRVTQSVQSHIRVSKGSLTACMYWLKEGVGSLIPVLWNRGLIGNFINITKVMNLELDN